MQIDFENLFCQHVEVLHKWTEEAINIYPSKNLIDDEEKWGEIVTKQGAYIVEKEEEWFRNYQKENNLSDYELGVVRRDLITINKKVFKKMCKKCEKLKLK